ncbi:MAG: gliding motility-associated C-terminal domain-containing protein [Phycisphaerae bacterium]|nr:gliding motility-associated C-terminal domain-containing protein [Saprospiraceae bacterium]
MRLPFTLLLLCWSLGILAQISTFDFDNEGWRCDGDPESTTAYWFSSGGNPGGHIQMTDASTGGTWYFIAPAKFLGPKCDAYGKFLRYDQFADDHSNPNTYADVEMKGGGFTLVFDHPVLPNLAWTHYDLFLREDAGWRINTTNGLVPTQGQFKQVLSNITSIRIRGEFHHVAVDYGGLDNVMLESNFHFDLDADNSSGLTNGDYRADTSCSAHSFVVGNDPILTSEGPIDSIAVILLNSNSLEALMLNGFPPNLLVIQYGPDHISIISLGNASAQDFLVAIQLLSYLDASTHPLQGIRLVEFIVYAGCGEAGRQRAHLPIFPPPSAGLPGDTTVCANTQPFKLFSVLTGFPDPGGHWEPMPSIGPGYFDPGKDSAGIYAYIFTPTSECPGDTAFVTVALVYPPALRPDTTLCYDNALRIEHPRELLTWEWGNGSQQPSIEVTEPGIYTLRGETEYCVFEDSVEISFITCKVCDLFVPNVFSPNDDGDNDAWHAFLPCRWLRFRLEVYDRWGSLVFAAEDPETTWDGRIRGKDAMTGVYVWRLEWDAELYGATQRWRAKGDVTVVR